MVFSFHLNLIILSARSCLELILLNSITGRKISLRFTNIVLNFSTSYLKISRLKQQSRLTKFSLTRNELPAGFFPANSIKLIPHTPNANFKIVYKQLFSPLQNSDPGLNNKHTNQNS
jgi:hypothetical protein